MSASWDLEGGPELADALRALGKSAGKNVLRRVGKKRLEPMRAHAAGLVRVRFGDLQRSIKVGTVLSKAQRAARGASVGGGSFRAAAKNSVQVYMGPGENPQAITEEFGKFNQAAHPYMRPAFDSKADGVIDGVGADLWEEIGKTAERARKKAARLLAKAGK